MSNQLRFVLESCVIFDYNKFRFVKRKFIRPRELCSRGLPKAYIGLTKPTKIPPLLSIFDFDACYEGSTGGQIGVEFNQKSTGDVGFFPALLLADQ